MSDDVRMYDGKGPNGSVLAVAWQIVQAVESRVSRGGDAVIRDEYANELVRKTLDIYSLLMAGLKKEKK